MVFCLVYIRFIREFCKGGPNHAAKAEENAKAAIKLYGAPTYLRRRRRSPAPKQADTPWWSNNVPDRGELYALSTFRKLKTIKMEWKTVPCFNRNVHYLYYPPCTQKPTAKKDPYWSMVGPCFIVIYKHMQGWHRITASSPFSYDPDINYMHLLFVTNWQFKQL